LIITPSGKTTRVLGLDCLRSEGGHVEVKIDEATGEIAREQLVHFRPGKGGAAASTLIFSAGGHTSCDPSCHADCAVRFRDAQSSCFDLGSARRVQVAPGCR